MRRSRRHIQSSVLWAGAESIVNILAALCATLVVGRVIGPEAFGLASIAFLVGSFAELFVSALYEPVIQSRRLHRGLLDAAFAATLTSSAAIYLIILALAPLLANLYSQPRLTSLLAVQGMTCLFAGARCVPEAIMARKLRFRQIAARTIMAKVAGSLVSVAAALLGMGAWSIILGNVTFAFGAAAMVISMTKRLPRLTIGLGGAASLWSFGVFSLLDNLLWSATLRLFYFFVSYFQGLRALGELSIAFRINDAGWALILAIAGRLALPMLSRVADDRQQLEEAFLEGTRIVCLMVSPVFLGLALTSREIIDLLLGPAWPMASPALVAVCLVSECLAVRMLAPVAVKALGRPSRLIGYNVIGLIYMSAASIALRNFDFKTVLWAWISFGLVTVVCSLCMIQKLIGINWLTQLKPLGSAVLPSLGMCGVVYGVMILRLDLSVGVILLLKVALSGLAYISLLVALERPLLKRFVEGFIARGQPVTLRDTTKSH
jgi:O-antigen/teichoic acid export membrane protein